MIKILVIGELCKDEFIYGSAHRICPEAPVPVFIPQNTTVNDGMAGNVVNNINGLGFEVFKFIHQNTPITKTRYIDKKSNQMLLRVDSGEENIDKIRIGELSDLHKYDVVIVSDYDKGFITNDDLCSIALNSRFSVLDTKKTLSDDIAKGFNFIKLNEQEYNNNKHLSKSNLLITLGSRGVLYNDRLYPQKNPMETIDVSGAGDTFVSAFTINYILTKDLDASIDFANKCASVVVSKRGVVPIKLTDLDE